MKKRQLEENNPHLGIDCNETGARGLQFVGAVCGINDA